MMRLITKQRSPSQRRRAIRRLQAPTPAERHALDELAKHAIREYEAGRTISLREWAKKHNLTLDGE